ncbi:MAG: hypothetical protein AB1568_17015 [Thermodesulfobacteriota bacterium]
MAVRILLLFALLCCLLPAQAARAATDIENTVLFNEANDFFRQGSARPPDQGRELYEKALHRYQKLVDAGIDNGRLYTNIANTWYRLGDLGRATVNYRRALAYLPDDPGLRHNAEFVFSLRRDRIEPRQQDKVLQTLFFWHYDLPYRVRLLLFSSCYVLTWGLAMLRLRPAAGIGKRMLAGALVLTLLLAGSLGIDMVRARTERAGVVVAAEIIARKGDGLAYQPAFTEPLHAGTEFRLVERRGNWLQVELASGSRCWLPAAAVEMVF